MQKKHYLMLLIAPFVGILLVCLQVYYSAYIWKYQGPEVIFQIKQNETFANINAKLKSEGLISSSRLFHRYAQLKGTMNKFKAGRYLIQPDSNLITVYKILMHEKSITTPFTVSEGKNMYEIGAMLSERAITDYTEFINLCKDQDFIASLGINAPTLEGYLYPETYNFDLETSAEQVIRAMVREFNKRTADINFSTEHLTQKLTKEQIITLASIIEKETSVDSERNIISGVFHNRLNKRMPLQSDPTTIYGMFENYGGNISRKDLRTPTDYNTYTLKALPIGPISNPSVDSIKAALNPAQHKYLFFVSKNEGTHSFSETYKQHQLAVEMWQKNRKNREGKSWRNKNENTTSSFSDVPEQTQE